MYAIIGATGKVGFATVSVLRQANVPVRAIVRDCTKANQLQALGCETAVAELLDTNALAKAIGGADVVQVILPPSPTAEDGAQDMRMTMESIASALERSGPKHVLAISDLGAHVNSDIGMPSMYGDFERRLSKLPCRKTILRSAPHIENWGRVIPAAMESGILPSFQDPVDMLQPTIAAADLGRIAASLLLRLSGETDLEILHAEGPYRYSAKDVANALGELFGRHVKAVAVPRSDWEGLFTRSVSSSLAELLMKTNDAQNQGGLVDVEANGAVRYGTTELIDAIRPMVVKT